MTVGVATDELIAARPPAWPVMLDWLGITLHVSSWGRDARAAEEGRAALCGSQRALLQTKEHMATAKEQLRGGAHVSFELAADYHG
jgi:hypothetical protein